MTEVAARRAEQAADIADRVGGLLFEAYDKLAAAHELVSGAAPSLLHVTTHAREWAPAAVIAEAEETEAAMHDLGVRAVSETLRRAAISSRRLGDLFARLEESPNDDDPEGAA